MKWNERVRSERGSISILVALSLTVLFGFSAMAVDYGMLASGKQQMQNAVDAAALAAATDLGSGNWTQVTETAKEYCRLNGFDPDLDNISMEINPGWKRVTVTLHQDSAMGFSSVLSGVNVRTISASATAEAVSIFGGCPYAMFAG